MATITLKDFFLTYSETGIIDSGVMQLATFSLLHTYHGYNMAFAEPYHRTRAVVVNSVSWLKWRNFGPRLCIRRRPKRSSISGHPGEQGKHTFPRSTLPLRIGRQRAALCVSNRAGSSRHPNSNEHGRRRDRPTIGTRMAPLQTTKNYLTLRQTVWVPCIGPLFNFNLKERLLFPRL